jgi:hypothetical protein
LYAADGILSLVDHVLSETTGSALLTTPRNVVARVTLLALGATWIVLASTPRLPKRVFAAPLLFSAWWVLGAPPLLLASLQTFDAVGISCQLATAALAFLLVRAAHGGYRLDPNRFLGPAFRLRSTVGFLALSLLLVPPAIVAGLACSAAAELERMTAGFVTFHGREIRIDERRYRRGDREVRLVGMMHLGEADSYRELFRSFRGPSTVVLEEGVTDKEGRLRRPLSYAAAARALGLSTQPAVEGVLDNEEVGDAEMPDLRNADVDLRDFRPETIAFLDAAGSLWSAQRPTEFVAALRAFARRDGAWTLFSTASEDILALRNRHLLEAIDEALDSYHCVIVPWGALHLAGIEAALKAQGFVEEGTSSRTLLRYATVFRALRDTLRKEGAAAIRAPEDLAPAR